MFSVEPVLLLKASHHINLATSRPSCSFLQPLHLQHQGSKLNFLQFSSVSSAKSLRGSILTRIYTGTLVIALLRPAGFSGQEFCSWISLRSHSLGWRFSSFIMVTFSTQPFQASYLSTSGLINSLFYLPNSVDALHLTISSSVVPFFTHPTPIF